MAIMLTLHGGAQVRLDRNLRQLDVSSKVNSTRGSGVLIEFQNNETPSRTVHVDPDAVVMIHDDGYPY